MTNGIIYIAFGDKCLKEFEYSVKSVRRFYDELPISLLTNRPYENKYVDDVRFINPKDIRVKQDFLYDSPYENTLYLDADTKIIGSIIEIFGLMKRFDLAATHDLIRKDKKKSKVYPDYALIPDGFPEFAGGVILFKKSPIVKKFFEIWKKNYAIWYDLTKEVRDQPSFRVSLWQCSDLRIHTLPSEFNIRHKNYHNIVPRIDHKHDMWKNK